MHYIYSIHGFYITTQLQIVSSLTMLQPLSIWMFPCLFCTLEPGFSFRLCCAADALRQSHAPAPPAQYDFRAVVAMLGCSDATRMVGKRVEGAGVMFPANLNCQTHIHIIYTYIVLTYDICCNHSCKPFFCTQMTKQLCHVPQIFWISDVFFPPRCYQDDDHSTAALRLERCFEVFDSSLGCFRGIEPRNIGF